MKFLAGGIILISGFVFLSAACSEGTGEQMKLEKIEALYQKYQKSFPDVASLSVDELLAMRTKENVVFVDVREPRERRVSTIPGALSAEEFERDIAKFKDSVIVTYCTIGSRSGRYAEKLQRKHKNMRVYNLKGSVLAWAHAGQQFVNDEGETHRVYVYGPQWNLLPDGYEGVW